MTVKEVNKPIVHSVRDLELCDLIHGIFPIVFKIVLKLLSRVKYPLPLQSLELLKMS